MNMRVISTDNTTADCNTEVNVCYDVVNMKMAVSADHTTVNLNTEAWEALH